MRILVLALVLPLLATAGLAAQIGVEEVVIATRLGGGAPATQLIRMDLNTGVQTPIGRFPSDHLAPLAVKIDPFDDDVLLALELPGGGGSRIVRLGLLGNRVRYERLVSEVSHRVEELSMGSRSTLDGVYYVVSGPAGGLFSVPRGGGAARQIVSLPWASAIAYVDSATPVVASSDPAGQAGPVLSSVFVLSGGLVTQAPLPGIGPRTVTGYADSPLGSFFGHADGTVAHILRRGPLQVQPITPVRPAGGTTAVRFTASLAFQGLALGDAADPTLKAYDPFVPGPQSWRFIGERLPGSPVDFDVGVTPPFSPLFYRTPCGGSLFMGGNGAQPRIGTPGFGLSVQQARPNAPVLLVVGPSDQVFGDVLLPVTLPGGCGLHVAPVLMTVQQTDANGRADQPLPIPNVGDLVGVRFHAQWLQDQPAGPGVATSGLVSVRIRG